MTSFTDLENARQSEFKAGGTYSGKTYLSARDLSPNAATLAPRRHNGKDTAG
jgi:hypothetical protein